MTVHTFSLLVQAVRKSVPMSIWLDGNIYKVVLNEVSVKQMYSIYLIRTKKTDSFVTAVFWPCNS